MYILQAFRAINCFLAKLQKVSEDPSLAAQMGEFKPTLSSFSVFKLQGNYLNISVNILQVYWPP